MDVFCSHYLNYNTYVQGRLDDLYHDDLFVFIVDLVSSVLMAGVAEGKVKRFWY